MAKLSIVVPVYNEQSSLTAVVHHLMKCKLPCEAEWIFVDDHSTDKSLDLLRQLSRQYPIRVLEQPANLGKGAAVIRGIQEATGEFFIIQDADFEYDPNDIKTLVEPLLDGRADVVYGSRFKNGPQVHRTFHYFINLLLTVLSNLMSGIYLTDMETCYKAFRMDIVKSMNLRSRRFGIEIEFTAYIAKVRLRIFELPITYFPRSRLQGKKISWKDGVAALWHLVRFNFFTSVVQAFKSIPSTNAEGLAKPYAPQ